MSKPHGTSPDERALLEAAWVERLAGMVDLEMGGQLRPVVGLDQRGHRVEELGHHHGAGNLLVGPDVVPVAQDDQVVAGGQHRLEQRLAHFGPGSGSPSSGEAAARSSPGADVEPKADWSIPSRQTTRKGIHRSGVSELTVMPPRK